jgi:heat shock transcription factor
MNRRGRAIKEEYAGGSSSTHSSGMASTAIPQPMEGLHDPGPPPFLTKTYDIIEDSSTNHIISWSRGNNSFVVWDPQAFSISLLPRYFKHNNFSSFVRQLNTYVSTLSL